MYIVWFIREKLPSGHPNQLATCVSPSLTFSLCVSLLQFLKYTCHPDFPTHNEAGSVLILKLPKSCVLVFHSCCNKSP